MIQASIRFSKAAASERKQTQSVCCGFACVIVVSLVGSSSDKCRSIASSSISAVRTQSSSSSLMADSMTSSKRVIKLNDLSLESMGYLVATFLE